MYWLYALLAIVGMFGIIIFFRQRQAAKEKAYLDAMVTQPERPAWGKQVKIPAKGPTCQAVKEIAGSEFKLDDAPQLPLRECTHKLDCQCKYQLLTEKRSGKERRDGVDRRPVVRYDPESPPRRNGRDRRKENNTAFNDRAI